MASQFFLKYFKNNNIILKKVHFHWIYYAYWKENPRFNRKDGGKKNGIKIWNFSIITYSCYSCLLWFYCLFVCSSWCFLGTLWKFQFPVLKTETVPSVVIRVTCSFFQLIKINKFKKNKFFLRKNFFLPSFTLSHALQFMLLSSLLLL